MSICSQSVSHYFDHSPINPCILIVGGSDSSGMAGISQDIKTVTALGAHPLLCINANTAQDTQQLTSVNAVNDQAFLSQLRAAQKFNPKIVKVGMLANHAQIKLLADWVARHQLKLIFDPVFKASSGDELFTSTPEPEQPQTSVPAPMSGAAQTQTQSKTQTQTQTQSQPRISRALLRQTFLLTPNIDEAAQLTGIKINSPQDVETAAERLIEIGANAVLIKGGHLPAQQSGLVQDYFKDRKRSFWLSSEKINTPHSRGTGCALASAAAAALAKGFSIYDAVVIAKMAINQGLTDASSVNGLPGPVKIKAFPKSAGELPKLSRTADFDFGHGFPACDQLPLGLYPVVDRADWVERLLAVGVSTIQLRIKDLSGEALEDEITQAIAISRRYQARLFINDHWQLAIVKGAYGVHLGQEDLDQADIGAIQKAGLRLGISSHCHYEVARAHAYRPSYIACGPAFATQTKAMPWVPQGLSGINYWRQLLDYPLVAIGGINRERLAAIAQTGVNGIAMISAITLSQDPAATTRAFMKLINQAQNHDSTNAI